MYVSQEVLRDTRLCTCTRDSNLGYPVMLSSSCIAVTLITFTTKTMRDPVIVQSKYIALLTVTYLVTYSRPLPSGPPRAAGISPSAFEMGDYPACRVPGYVFLYYLYSSMPIQFSLIPSYFYMSGSRPTCMQSCMVAMSFPG